MATRLTDEEKVQNVERFWKLVELMPEGRASNVKKMFEADDIAMNYFTAPASSREEYHDCIPGGLLHHSLTVVANLFKLVKAFHGESQVRWNKGTLAFVGLFHDFGKMGDGVHPMYIPEESDWHRARGKLYSFHKDCIKMPNAELGLFVMQKHGLRLGEDEYLSIRLNDGQYDETNKWYKSREPELALLTHWADMRSVVQDKAGE